MRGHGVYLLSYFCGRCRTSSPFDGCASRICRGPGSVGFPATIPVAHAAPVRVCSSASSFLCSLVCPHSSVLPVTCTNQSSLCSVDCSLALRCVFCDCER